MMGKRLSLWAIVGLGAILASSVLYGSVPDVAAQGDTLTQTYTTGTGIAFNYPDGWTVIESVEGDYTLVELDNTPSANEKDLESALVSGEVKIAFIMAPASQMFADMGLPAGANPQQMLDMLLDPSVYSFGPSYEATMGSAPAARVDGSANDNRFDFIILAGQLGDGTAVIVQANTAWGEVGSFEPTLLAICNSITASAGPTTGDTSPETSQGDTLPQSYDDPGGVITLNYPDGWVVDKYFGIIFIANSQAAIEGDMTSVETGELQINLMAGAAYEVGLPESGTALEMAQSMIAEAAADPEISNVAGPDALEGFQYDAARVSITQGSADIIGIVILADEQHAAMLLAGAPQGEMSQHEETILAIARSIQFVDAGGGAVEEPADAASAIPENNAVNWQTDTVSLTADNFYIVTNGQTFTAAVDYVDVDGDPGDETYTTLEVSWEEHGVPMRMYMYFESDGSIWQAFEIRIYDGSPDGEWVYFEEPAFTTPRGEAYQILSFGREYYDRGLYFENLRLQAFTSAEAVPDATAESVEAPPDTTETGAVPATLSGPQDCHNVAVSIGDYSSEYSSGYAPINLLDDDPSTGWSSDGYGTSEFVVINLDGMQTVYGVLFNSYSPSSGYETDSIKDFSIETTTPSGERRAIYIGQAAFQPGYQVYTFDPVETGFLMFVFTSTHGGAYFEAADIMVCAVESAPPPGQEVRQWASDAIATSQYSDTGWSAVQATGAPDTLECGDNGTAWASSDPNGIDALYVFFDTPVIPTQINIYQTYNPGAIANITLLLADGSDGPSVPSSADPGTSCPGVFTVNVPDGLTQGQPVGGIVILVDQSNHVGWNEIDAVELVGYAPTAEATASEPAEPTEEAEQPPVASAQGTADLPQSHTTENGQISFNYPDGWFVYEDLNIPYIYSSETAQSHLSWQLESGDVAVQITKNSLPGLFGADPSEHITAFMEGLVSALGLTSSGPTATTINGYEAAYALATSDTWSMWGIAIAVTDDMMIEVLAYTAPGEFEQYESILMSIAQSVVYTP
ncbi:MAG: discoidin domain-containing protein [Anaerolineae bacterium]|nr:discoidin domain-containing protein [Anaerolineae bacterium]